MLVFGKCSKPPVKGGNRSPACEASKDSPVRERGSRHSPHVRGPGKRDMENEWTPVRVGVLIGFWKEGLPTSEIGRRLQVTKNAVVGKVHRLGLAKRRPSVDRKPKEAEIIKLDALGAGMCSWPEGEPGTDAFRFCGRPAVDGKPYCGEHCARAYVKNTRDRKVTRAA